MSDEAFDFHKQRALNNQLREAVVYGPDSLAGWKAIAGLLDRGADLHFDNEAPLTFAVFWGKEFIVTMLLQHGAVVRAQHLQESARHNDLELFEQLLHHWQPDEKQQADLLNYLGWKGLAAPACILLKMADNPPGVIEAARKGGLIMHEKLDDVFNHYAQSWQAAQVITQNIVEKLPAESRQKWNRAEKTTQAILQKFQRPAS